MFIENRCGYPFESTSRPQSKLAVNHMVEKTEIGKIESEVILDSTMMTHIRYEESSRNRKAAVATSSGGTSGVSMNTSNYIIVLIILVILLACSIGIVINYDSL